MEKIALDVIHEVELYSNSDLEAFDAQLFLLTTDNMQFVFDLKREKKSEHVFTFKIPKKLQEFLKEPVKYKVYVYLDNARFLADDGNLQVISQENFSGTKLLNPANDVKFSAKIKAEEPEEKKKVPKKAEVDNKPTEKPKPKQTTETKKEDAKTASKKESPKPKEKKEDSVKESEKINVDELLEQHKNIKTTLNSSKKSGTSLRDYAERLERKKKLSENKEEINKKIKDALSSFK